MEADVADEKQIFEEGIGEVAFRRIRDDIVAGALPPGKKLKLDSLKARYGASVSTLREILNRLASEQLVVAEGQRKGQIASAAAPGDLAALLASIAHGLSIAGRGPEHTAVVPGAVRALRALIGA